MVFYYIIAILNPFLASLGHVFLKIHAVSTLNADSSGVRRFLPIAVGVVCFAVSSLIAVYVMVRMDFSAFYSFTALNYVFISVLSHRYLGETIDRWKIIGNVIIILGIVIYNFDNMGK